VRIMKYSKGKLISLTILLITIVIISIMVLADFDTNLIIISKAETIKLPKTLTVFEVKSIPWDAVEGLAMELLGEKCHFVKYIESKHAYIFSNDSWILEVYECGSINLYKVEANTLKPPNKLPDLEEAKKIAVKELNKIVQLLSKYVLYIPYYYKVMEVTAKPGQTVHVKAGLRLIKVNGTWIEEIINEDKTYIKNLMVEFKVKLNGFPVIYKDGAVIIIGDYGRVSRVTVYMKNIKPKGEVEIANLDEVKEALKKHFKELADKIIIENINLTYFSKSPVESVKYLKPVFHISCKIESKGKLRPYEIILSAEKGKVEVILSSK